ncbi:MAG: hypothetical protein P8X79_23225, partial [Reinekea sp.]
DLVPLEVLKARGEQEYEQERERREREKIRREEEMRERRKKEVEVTEEDGKIEERQARVDDAGGEEVSGSEVVPDKQTPTQRAQKTVAQADKPLEPVNPNKAQHGHGNAEHGSQTTPAQQEHRIVTGVKPSGQPGNPTSKASKFLTPELEAEALGRGRNKLEQELSDQNIPDFVNGEPNRHAVTVETNNVSGFGERWVRAKDANGQNLKDANGDFIPQKDPVVLKKAKLIYEYIPSTNRWEPVTYFPVQ